MKTGLVLGVDHAGKTLLLRQLALFLARDRKTLLDKVVALAHGATCMSASATEIRAVPPPPRSAMDFSTTDMLSDRDLALDDDLETHETVGVEHSTLVVDNRTFALFEVGGQLLPMWSAYFDTCEFWMFVVDVADATLLPGAAIEFLNIMAVDSMRHKPKLLVFNKIDAISGIDDAKLRAYFALDRLITDAFSPISTSGPMHVIKASARTGENIESVVKWLQHCSSGASVSPMRFPISPSARATGPSTSTVTTTRYMSRLMSVQRPEHRVHPVNQ